MISSKLAIEANFRVQSTVDTTTSNAPKSIGDISLSVQIDPRSYHVFQEMEIFMLFDRATAALIEIPPAMFELLQAVEHGVAFQEALAWVELQNPLVDSGELLDLVRSLQGRGFFRYIPVDHAEQRKLIEGLWRHKPRRIQLLMAQSCNLGCRYCYAWRNGSNQRNVLMSWPVAKRAVDFLVARSGKRPNLMLTFFGGEPLLNYTTIRQVVEYCESIKEQFGKTFSYELVTNGTLLTQEVAEFLAEHQFLLMISIDGWREMHEYNRPALRKGGDYDAILANALHVLKIYQERGLPEIKVRANLTDKFHESDKVRQFLHSLGFTKVGISPIEPLSHGDRSPSAMTDDQVEEMMLKEYAADLASLDRLAQGERLSSAEGFRLRRLSQPMTPVLLKGLACGVNRNTAVVDTKGNIYPCHRYEGMENYIVGNVFTGMDREKTIGYYFKVNGNATNRCHSCWIRDYCAGGCAWLLSAKDGNLVDPTPQECDRRRRAMEQGLFLRSKLRMIAPGWLANNGNRSFDEWNWNEAAVEESSCGSCNECGSGCGS
jgi:uncharacterized protein